MRHRGGIEDIRFFRAGYRSAGELIQKLRSEALIYNPDARGLWDMTAAELYETADGGRRRNAMNARQNELLAFNTAALVLAAFNAPRRFPRTPEEAFGRAPESPADGGKSSFMAFAEQLNRRIRTRTKEQEQSDNDDRRT